MMKEEGIELSIQNKKTRKRTEYTGWKEKEENWVYRMKREGREPSLQNEKRTKNPGWKEKVENLTG